MSTVSHPQSQPIDIGGIVLHATVMGETATERPSVIFEAGLGGVGFNWGHIQPHIAEQTLTVSYDRAGAGRSSPSPRPRTPKAIAQELERLLTQLGVAPPYVLVGHSLGGLLQRYFADQRLNAVAGLVLVDASHEMQMVRAGMPERLLSVTRTLYGVGCRLARVKKIGRFLAARLFTSIKDDLNSAEWEHLITLAASPSHFATMRDEVRQFGELFGANHVIPTTFGSTPLRVISAGSSLSNSKLNQQHQQNQLDLTQMSTHSQQVTLPDATHLTILSNFQHAQIVANTILDLV